KAVAKLTRDGTFIVEAATHELGTGTCTSMTQIAADALGVPVTRVRFELGDSAFPENPISAGSMTAASTGPAVHAAALALRDRLVVRRTDPADADACRTLVEREKDRVIEVHAGAKPGEEQQAFSMHSFGAVFVEVRVDPDLGEVRVARVVGAYGIG